MPTIFVNKIVKDFITKYSAVSDRLEFSTAGVAVPCILVID